MRHGKQDGSKEKKAIRQLPVEDLFLRLLDSEKASRAGGSSFTLILGAGFSYGIIPTTSQIVREDLSRWVTHRRDVDRRRTVEKQPEPGPAPESDNFFDWPPKKQFDATIKAEAVEFWKKVKAAADALKLPAERQFELDGENLPRPDKIAEAYRFALSADCTPGLYTPDLVRRYFADVVKRIDKRLNPAHLYLAAIIESYPKLFRTIFTTNLDPLLQRALQLMNVPYFVSDRPDTLQHPDDDTDAIHLVHAHGSIYRYLLLNSPEEIKEFADRNESLLQEYFRKHSLLIVGYSGWDDAITRALQNVGRFAHALYWCDRGENPEKSGLSPVAKRILRRHPNAFYVSCKSADQLMIDLHLKLTDQALPKIFHDPISSVVKQFEYCVLTGHSVKRVREAVITPRAIEAELNTERATDRNNVDDDVLQLGEELGRVKIRLQAAEVAFSGLQNAADQRRARILKQLADTAELYLRSDWDAVIQLLDEIIGEENLLDVADRALARFRRGTAIYRSRHSSTKEDCDRMIIDLTAAIETNKLSFENLITAYSTRSFGFVGRDTTDDYRDAQADLTFIIEFPEATSRQKSNALLDRGINYYLKDEYNHTIIDITASLQEVDADPGQNDAAHYFRARAFHERNQLDDVSQAITDYKIVIANKNARDYWVSNAKEALEKLEARLNVGTKSTHSRKRRKT